jgi:hypothetical protein
MSNQHKARRAVLLALCTKALCLALLAPDAIASQKTVTGTGKSVISDDTSYARAKNTALNQARAAAVDRAAGVTVSSFTLLQDSMIVSDFTKSFSRGFIIKENILSWQGEWVDGASPKEPGYPVLTVNIRATVLTPDESFYKTGLIQLTLNREKFQSGDTARITVTSASDMYILLANYTTTGEIIHLFPNEFSTANWLERDKPLVIPPKDSKGTRILLSTPQSYDQSTEAFIVIGIPKTPKTETLRWSALFPTNKSIPYAEYMQTIVTLPIPWLTEETKFYTIHR